MADPLDIDDAHAMRILEFQRNIAQRRYSEAVKEIVGAERKERDALDQIAAIDRALSALLERIKEAAS